MGESLEKVRTDSENNWTPLFTCDTFDSFQMVTSTRSHSDGSWIRYLKRRVKTKVMWCRREI